LTGYRAHGFTPLMPVVALDLTEDEANRIDAIATDEKRVRKQQTHILVLIGLDKIESEKATNTSEEGEPS
jgi:hypothetical protein